MIKHNNDILFSSWAFNIKDLGNNVVSLRKEKINRILGPLTQLNSKSKITNGTKQLSDEKIESCLGLLGCNLHKTQHGWDIIYFTTLGTVFMSDC